FFSSRRRHTRSKRDWSSDVCSSDLVAFPEWFGHTYERSATLRYGENPHQAAALYVDPSAPAGLAQAEQFHGKEMSYNNYTDSDRSEERRVGKECRARRGAEQGRNTS